MFRYCLLAFLLSARAFGQNPAPQVIDIAAPRIIDVDLRDLPVPPAWQPGDGIREVPRQGNSFARRPSHAQNTPDPLLPQQQLVLLRQLLRPIETPFLNFDGQDFSGSTPADPVGAVGRDYYIQAVNFRESSNDFTTAYAVYDKQTGDLVTGPFLLEDLGMGNCGAGKGDPIILYDQLANRWLLSEFTENALATICVYISRTDDPITGGWFNYSFQAPEFPDYPKFGLHPSAYFVSSQESSPAAWALDRQRMLAGQAATFVRFQTAGLDGFSFDPLTPADLDGPNAPAASAPGFFMRHNDDEFHSSTPDPSQDFLELYSFSSGFGGSAGPSFDGPIRIGVSDFNSDLCSSSPLVCIPQPDGPSQDAIREVIMHRLVYRLFDVEEVLLGAFTVDGDGNDLAAIRWFELRKPIGSAANAWALYQEGSYSLDDGLHRWMPSPAMDQSGNIAIGFRAGSSTENTSLRYVGRLATDPLGVMTTSEQVIVSSDASNFSNRNGDYAALTIDPDNDCDFWFTAEYFPSSQWRTRLAAFSFENCGCARPETPQITSALTTPGQDRSVSLSWQAAAGAATYSLFRIQGACDGALLEPIAEGISETSFVDTTPTGSLPFSYQIRAFAADNCPSFISDCVTVVPTGPCTLPAQFSGLASVTSNPASACGLLLSWPQAVSSCGSAGDIRYHVYRGDSADFIADETTLYASCLDATSFVDALVIEGETYYYSVRAEDLSASGDGPCGGLMEENDAVLGATVIGPLAEIFSELWENGAGAFVFEALAFDQSQRSWGLNTLDSVSGTTSIFVGFSERQTDQVFRFPDAQAIGAAWKLTFAHRFNTEPNIDGGVLEYTLDGSTWHDITAAADGVAANPDRMSAFGYTGTISANSNTPLAGRAAFTGSRDWQFTVVDLSEFEGLSVNFRWRAVGDAFNASEGWRIDDITLTQRLNCGPACDADLLFDRWREPFVSDIRIMIHCINSPKP